MMIVMIPGNFYGGGASYAVEVQRQLTEGVPFPQIDGGGAPAPEQAIDMRDQAKTEEMREFWRGYLSRWD